MKAGYERHRIDISNIMPHVETDKLIDEQMPLWPPVSNPQEYHDFQSLALEKVKCPDCRVVFERAFAERRNRPASRNSKINDQSSTLNPIISADQSSDISVWVCLHAQQLLQKHCYANHSTVMFS